MRIGVNALTLVPDRIGGLEHYLRRVLAALLRGSSLQFVVFTSPAAADTFEPVPGRLDVRRLASDASDPELTRALSAAALDVWWCPWVDWRPYRPGVPLVVTVPDLQHEHLPEMFTPEELAARRVAYFAAGHLAHAVMTFSDHAREDLCRVYGVPPERVHAIPLAEGLDWEASEPRPERVAELRASCGEGFLYYPANAWPHKDHATLLAALRSLRERGRDLRLVLTGHFGAGQAALVSEVRRLGLDSHVSLLGVVEPEDVRALYRLAAALVCPSLFEGFGFPLLEALRSGTPVICAEATSLPEVGAQAVLYFRAGDRDALVSRIEVLLDDASLRADLIRRGLERARAFSWERTAGRVADVFSAAYAGDPPATPPGRALEGLAGRLGESAQALELVSAESAERLAAMGRLESESAERLAAMGRLERELAERLAAMGRLENESAERLAAMGRLESESAARLVALDRADTESAERLAAMGRLAAESTARLGVIERLSAGLRELEAAAALARPRAWHGLATPWELRRARREFERLQRILQQLVSSP